MDKKPLHKPRKIKVPKESYLQNVALFYLERFAATAAMLRRVLVRRVERAARAGVIDEAGKTEAMAAVELVVKRAVASGLVNDAVYAEARVTSLLRKGKSSKWMAQDLAERGIAREIQTEAIESLTVIHGDPQSLELEAALTLARRRRIGPFRPLDNRSLDESEIKKRRLREMGIMARAGFDFGTAAQVIDQEASLES
ncbi:MAG: RecX family transcriptional regulator [Candidatus Pacebacteria bacterium]|nr:RecX family transcriptional regulator [Candidatus Paceibacterota bacterium]